MHSWQIEKDGFVTVFRVCQYGHHGPCCLGRVGHYLRDVRQTIWDGSFISTHPSFVPFVPVNSVWWSDAITLYSILKDIPLVRSRSQCFIIANLRKDGLQVRIYPNCLEAHVLSRNEIDPWTFISTAPDHWAEDLKVWQSIINIIVTSNVFWTTFLRFFLWSWFCSWISLVCSGLTYMRLSGFFCITNGTGWMSTQTNFDVTFLG